MQTSINTYTAKSAIRFRRYSRNAYAVFASIGKNVTIGNVASYIADAQLIKGFKKQSLSLDVVSKDADESNDESIFDNTIADTIFSNLIAILVPASVVSETAASYAYANTYKI